MGRDTVVVDHAFREVADKHFLDVLDLLAPPMEGNTHRAAFREEARGRHDVRAAAPRGLGHQLGMAADLGRGEVDDGLDAVVLHAEFEDLADLVGDGIEVPDVAMIMLAARISVANVLVREGDARVFWGDVAENGTDLRHY